MGHEEQLPALAAFLQRIPAVKGSVGTGEFREPGLWWAKLTIDIDHPLAWHAVQELGHVLNYVSLTQRLPTVFMPVSPPPYLNGGPEFLSWVIESRSPDFSPSQALEWLSGRLPKPVEDESAWLTEDQEGQDDVK